MAINLKGHETAAIKSYKHDESDSFGCAVDEDEDLLNAVIRQAMLSGYLKQEIESYGILKITSAGKKFLKKPTEFKVPVEGDGDGDSDDMENMAGCAAADDVLYSILKDTRKKLSKKMNVPPFVIFQDPSLEAMATTYPITYEELQNIPGVGAGKAAVVHFCRNGCRAAANDFNLAGC